MDRGGYQATVHGASESRTQLSKLKTKKPTHTLASLVALTREHSACQSLVKWAHMRKQDVLPTPSSG